MPLSQHCMFAEYEHTVFLNFTFNINLSYIVNYLLYLFSTISKIYFNRTILL